MVIFSNLKINWWFLRGCEKILSPIIARQKTSSSVIASETKQFVGLMQGSLKSFARKLTDCFAEKARNDRLVRPDIKNLLKSVSNPSNPCAINYNPNRNNPPLKYRKIAPVLYSKFLALAALVVTVT